MDLQLLADLADLFYAEARAAEKQRDHDEAHRLQEIADELDARFIRQTVRPEGKKSA